MALIIRIGFGGYIIGAYRDGDFKCWDPEGNLEFSDTMAI